LRLQLLPTLRDLEEWMPRRLDQVLSVLISFRKIENTIPLRKSDEKTRILRNLLNVLVLSYFEHHLRRRLKAEDSELHDNEIIELVLREIFIGLKNIPKRAICVKNIK
jgi:hypothetical protein